MLKPAPYLAILSLCAACGGTAFQASDGAAGGAQGGADNSAGRSSAAGASSAGASSSGGSASGGAAATGGDAAAGGDVASAGSGGDPVSNGGASAGAPSTAGSSSGGASCATLKTEYAGLVQKARVCDAGSTNQCSPSSTAPTAEGCGCPTLVNAKSEYTTLAKKKYDEIQTNKCVGGIVCNAFCAPATAATCSPETTGTAYACSGLSK